MCKFMSGIVLKNKLIYDIDIDSHEDLLKKANLNDGTINPNFVRVELLPEDGDVFNHDLKNWKLKVDQDFRPDWFDDKEAEKEMKLAIKEVFEQRFIVNRVVKEIKEGRWFVS